MDIWFFRRTNNQIAPVICRPFSCFNSFLAGGNQIGPRLFKGDCFINHRNHFTKVPGDTVFEGCSGGSGGYRYNLYPAGSNGCDLSRGKFYILGVTNMESVSGQHLQSPGFKECGFDWYSAGFEWYAGSFEK
ncbi:MAG: hypothetical protein US71_C0003G0001 [Parcubacteria group bacterium GW2011_GWD2_38_12]|nr:MAG: hypothetical protein US71_C0003G0001 [Parcubacteria group bacterium GW2011_GWD2_38_12]